ncbi:Putative ribonuclease H protein [Arachis hypogaea]|uniref:Ribonuclease H protein n=1 Tax=Arachis hypogaea TaxID=3818 RepID=A0A6B9V919_ARAHY|nr:Putative ribonuclease H protein [Arachis hypogaea]
MHEKEALWARVIYAKYGRNRNILQEMHKTSADSPLWKALANIRETFTKHTLIAVGDGRSTMLWLDRWVKDAPPLIQLVNNNIESINIEMKVNEGVLGDGNWNIQLFKRYLPEDIFEHIRALVPANENLGADTIRWGLSHDGMFTVSSAYKAIAD